MPDPRIDPKPVPPAIDPIDAAESPHQPQYPQEHPVDKSGWGSGIALFALLAIAVLTLIWLFSGPNQPVQNTAQNEPAITEPVQPTQPAQPEQPAQPQPDQPPPPAGNNATQP